MHEANLSDDPRRERTDADVVRCAGLGSFTGQGRDSRIIRVLRPGNTVSPDVAAARRSSARFVTLTAAGVGFAAGLLANGGGFLLVPFFLLALGLDMNEATGTSFWVAMALTIPTLVTHAFIGDIDWAVAGLFAVGLIPGTLVGGQLARQLPMGRLRNTFGLLLVGFAVWFLVRELGLSTS